MNQLCKVCGEPAAGYHFGAFTCEGCKSFFGRTYNNLSALGECKNNGQCVINKKNRTSCKSCRLKKCLTVGMSKSGSRYGRRSNWFKIHCLIQDQAEMNANKLLNNNNNSSTTNHNTEGRESSTSVRSSPSSSPRVKDRRSSASPSLSTSKDSLPHHPSLRDSLLQHHAQSNPLLLPPHLTHLTHQRGSTSSTASSASNNNSSTKDLFKSHLKNFSDDRKPDLSSLSALYAHGAAASDINALLAFYSSLPDPVKTKFPPPGLPTTFPVPVSPVPPAYFDPSVASFFSMLSQKNSFPGIGGVGGRDSLLARASPSVPSPPYPNFYASYLAAAAAMAAAQNVPGSPTVPSVSPFTPIGLHQNIPPPHASHPLSSLSGGRTDTSSEESSLESPVRSEGSEVLVDIHEPQDNPMDLSKAKWKNKA